MKLKLPTNHSIKHIYVSFLFVILCSITTYSQVEVKNNVIKYSFSNKNYSSNITNCDITDKGYLIANSNKPFAFMSEMNVVPNQDNAPFHAVGIRIVGNVNLGEVEISILTSNDGISFENKYIFDENHDVEKGIESVLTNLVFIPANSKYWKIQLLSKVNSNSNVTISGLDLSFINPGKSTRNFETAKVKKTNSDPIPKPSVVTRSDWGCPQGQTSGWTPSYTTVTHLIVHHSAGENTSSDWAAVVRSIWSYHTYTNGWGDIGYNYLIDPNGVIYEGRAGGDNAVGAHFCGTNANTMGTCMMGTFTDVTPRPFAINSLKLLLGWKAFKEGIDPLGTTYHPSSGLNVPNLAGHRDGCSTECPGNALYAYLPTVRGFVSSYLSSIPARVVYTEPSANSGLLRAYRPIKIVFNTAMAANLQTEKLYLSPNTLYTISWENNRTMYLTPAPRWNFNENYVLTIDSTVKNIFGASLDGDNNGVAGGNFVLPFSTTSTDVTPPTIAKWYPNGENVDINTECKFVFDEWVYNLSGRVKLLDSTLANVPYTAAVVTNKDDNSIVYLRPSSSLTVNKLYYAKFLAGIKDYFGNTTTQDILLPFRTQVSQSTNGQVFDNCEVFTDWNDPYKNLLSSGTDSIQTTLTQSFEKCKSSSYSIKLTYKFNVANDSKVAITKNLPITLNTADNTAVWIFGDLSGNFLNFLFGNDSQIVIPYGNIDWYGWKLCAVNTASIPYIDKVFSGCIISHVAYADTAGTVYFDDFQTNALVNVSDKNNNQIEGFYVEQNFPNPFNPSTIIRFSLPEANKVTINIYNTLGEKVQVLTDDFYSAGLHSISFNATNLPNGIYFYNISSGKNSLTKKMVLLK